MKKRTTCIMTAMILTTALLSGCAARVQVGDVHNANAPAVSQKSGAEGEALPDGWTAYDLAAAHASVAFPGEPMEDEGSVDIGKAQVTRIRYVYPGPAPNYVVYVLNTSELEESNPMTGGTEDELVQALKDYAEGLASSNGGETTEIETLQFHDHTAVNYSMTINLDGDEVNAYAITFPDDHDNLVSLMVTGVESEDAKTFWKSYISDGGES